MHAIPQLRQGVRSPLHASAARSTTLLRDGHQPMRSERSAAFRVLIVDDNRDAADSMALLLNRLGNQVCVAYGGAEALQAFPAFRPDVVLLDIGMPGINGHDLARQIRAMRHGDSVLMIALTGFSSRQDKRLSHDAGIDHHSVKPVDAIILQRLIEIQIGDRRRMSQAVTQPVTRAVTRSD